MDDHALKTLEYDAIRARLANETASSLGGERALAMTPLTSIPAVQNRLDETAEARLMLQVKGGIPLGGVSDIRPALRQAEIGGVLEAEQLLAVSAVAAASRSLKAFLAKADAASWPLLTAYGGQLGTFQSLENEIENAIAPNGQIVDSASPELARIRSRKRSAESRLREKLNSIVSGSLRTYLQDPVIVQRNDRMCVPVKAEHRGAFGGIVHDTSASGATLFIEPASVVDLGNETREMAIQERQEVYRILLKLSGTVVRFLPVLLATVDLLGELDFIVARAHLSNRMNAVEPEIASNGVSRFLSARHPLIDPDVVVPIDISLGEERNKVLLITGPNTGGKTVTLKTVGLLTLMAQSGLHVPATRAHINVFADIFTDIGDEQSIQQSLSTFSAHITNIARILSQLGTNSLVLLDEVGAGTDPAEGAAIARALLEYLLRRNARVVATTHYGELKSFAYMTDGVENASVEFDDVTLHPTYRLLQGIPGSSNAIVIAGRLGLPEELLAAARQRVTGRDDTSQVIQSLEEAKRSALGEAQAAQQARKEARLLREKAEQELSHYEQLRHEIRQTALEEARKIIGRAQQKASDLVAELKRSARAGPVESIDRAGALVREQLRDVDRSVVDDIDRLLALPAASDVDEAAVDGRPVHAGDRVRVQSLGLAGVLVDEPDGADKVTVQVGQLRVTVSPAALSYAGPASAAPAPSRPQPVVRVDAPSPGDSEARILEAASVPGQLTLLGQRADEAVMSLDRYLDMAHAAGLQRVRIVHGKGTGTLRRVVREHLRTHPYVGEYAIADAAEGGDGATVVTMKE